MDVEILSRLRIREVTSVNSIYSAKNAGAVRRSRERWAIILKYEGESVYYTESGEYVSNANNIFILPKGSNYRWQCVNAGYYSVIEFECELECSDIFHFPVRDSVPFLKIFKELEYKRNLGVPFYDIECLKGAYALILKLVNSRPQAYLPTRRAEKIQPALDYMAKNYCLEMSNDTLASLCGISTVYFRKLFFEICGNSPMKYVHSLRMEKAKGMLKTEHAKISDIAITVGYPDVFTFSKNFRKHVGMSPRAYSTMGKEGKFD